MTNWQSNDQNLYSQGSPRPVGGDPAPSGPTTTRRWLLPTLIAVAVVVAVGAGVAGAAIGYDNGANTSAASFAARPTPTATVTATVVSTPAPKTVTKVETESETKTETETETETATPEAPATLSREGSIQIQGADNWKPVTGGCEGDSGYDDLTTGATVIVYDGTNNNAGAGSLDKSEISGTSCKMSFSISDVVGGSNVYLVEVASRGKLKAELVGDTLFYFGTIGE